MLTTGTSDIKNQGTRDSRECTRPEWLFAAGTTLNGFTVGHLAKRIGNPNTAFIVGVREVAGQIFVLLDYPKAQPLNPSGLAFSSRFEVLYTDIASTWRPVSVTPHKRPGRPVVHPIGSAPDVVPEGYSLYQERLVHDVEALRDQFKGRYVVLVESAPAGDGRRRIGIFTWNPAFSRWRHGGYYVGNVSHINGGIGCVSSNYVDKKWRIVCDDRRLNLNEPGDFTFPSRDAAARAELEYTTALKRM